MKSKKILLSVVCFLLFFVGINDTKVKAAGCPNSQRKIEYASSCTKLDTGKVSISNRTSSNGCAGVVVKVSEVPSDANYFLFKAVAIETGESSTIYEGSSTEAFWKPTDQLTTYRYDVTAYHVNGDNKISAYSPEFSKNYTLGIVPPTITLSNTDGGILVTASSTNCTSSWNNKYKVGYTVSGDINQNFLFTTPPAKSGSNVYNNVVSGEKYYVTGYVYLDNGSQLNAVSDSVTIIYNKPDASDDTLNSLMSFDMCSVKNMKVGDSAQLNIPSNLKSSKYWSLAKIGTTASNIITVDSSGKLKAVSNGEATVNLTFKGLSATKSCKINVEDDSASTNDNTSISSCSMGSLYFRQNGKNIIVKFDACNSSSVAKYALYADGKQIGSIPASLKAITQSIKVAIPELGKNIKYQVKALDKSGKEIGKTRASSYTSTSGEYQVKVTYGCLSSSVSHSMIPSTLYATCKEASDTCKDTYPSGRVGYPQPNCGISKCEVVMVGQESAVTNCSSGGSSSGSGSSDGSSSSSNPTTSCSTNQISVSVGGAEPVCISAVSGSKTFVGAKDFCDKTKICEVSGSTIKRIISYDNEEYYTLLTTGLEGTPTSILTSALVKIPNTNAITKYSLKSIDAENNVVVNNDVIYISASYIAQQLGNEVNGNESSITINSDDYNNKYYQDNKLTLVYSNESTSVNKEFEIVYNKTNKTYEVELPASEKEGVKNIANWKFNGDNIKYIHKISSSTTDTEYTMNIIFTGSITADGMEKIPGFIKVKVKFK